MCDYRILKSFIQQEFYEIGFEWKIVIGIPSDATRSMTWNLEHTLLSKIAITYISGWLANAAESKREFFLS